MLNNLFGNSWLGHCTVALVKHLCHFYFNSLIKPCGVVPLRFGPLIFFSVDLLVAWLSTVSSKRRCDIAPP